MNARCFYFIVIVSLKRETGGGVSQSHYPAVTGVFCWPQGFGWQQLWLYPLATPMGWLPKDASLISHRQSFSSERKGKDARPRVHPGAGRSWGVGFIASQTWRPGTGLWSTLVPSFSTFPPRSGTSVRPPTNTHTSISCCFAPPTWSCLVCLL